MRLLDDVVAVAVEEVCNDDGLWKLDCVGVVVTEMVENFWYKINLPVLLESLLFSVLTPIEVWITGDVSCSCGNRIHIAIK